MTASSALREITAAKHVGFIPHPMRPIECNIQNAFTRYRDSAGRIFWVYLPHKPSTLSARVHVDTISRSIEISVYEQDAKDPTSPIKGISINQWSTVLSMDEGEWEKGLAELAGIAMKQAEKQPRCLCGSLLFIQKLSDRSQVFACSQFPNCSRIATIKDYGYSFQ